MFTRFERMVALRYLLSRRKESFISVIAGFSLTGIALGVATLIVVMSVMNGFRTELLEKILGINSHIYVYSPRGTIKDFEELKDKIKNTSQVNSVIPIVEGQVMIASKYQSTGAMVKGIKLEDFKNRKLLGKSLVSGSLENFNGEDAILIGARMAQNLRLRVGNKVKLISPQTHHTVLGSIPRNKDFKIAGIFEVGMYEYDNVIGFMPLKAAQTYFRLPNAVNSVEVMVDDPEQTKEKVNEIIKIVGREYVVNDWKLTNSHLFNALKVERNVMFLILTLIIIIAAFNIISSMIMLVKDKTKDVAILRTMGASRASILKIFILCGSLIGVTGTMIGFGLGLAFALNIETIKQWVESLSGTELFSPEVYFLSQLPSEVQTWDVVMVVIMALALSFLSTIYPALKAARLNPAEGLQYE